MSDRRRLTDGVSRRQVLHASAMTMAAPAVLQVAQGAERLGAATATVADYLHQRLKQCGASTLFGVPGATCDPFFAAAARAGVEVVVTSSDLEAGYAADGYARVRGLGVVSVTAGVGTLSMVAPIAGAFVERSPVVVVNGGPTPEDLKLQSEFGSLFSHSTGRPQSDLTIFREVTCFAERLDSRTKAGAVIDAALTAALTQKRPVYLEVPKNLWDALGPGPEGTLTLAPTPSGQEAALAASVLEKLKRAKKPVLLLGIEVQRFGLADAVTALVERLGIPWTTTLLSKAVIDERTKGFAGVYGGDRSVPQVKQLLDTADVVLSLGCVFGRQHRKLATQRADVLISASSEGVRTGKKIVKADLRGFLDELAKAPWTKDPAHLGGRALTGLSFKERRSSVAPAAVTKDAGLTYDEVMGAVSDALDDSCIAITDTSLSMYPAAELNTVGRQAFLSNSVWQSIGFSVAAAVGVGVGQQRRPVVVCGDGGFQMTAQALSTLARRQVPAIVVVLDNAQYGIEQWLLEPKYFQDPAVPLKPYLALNAWDYGALATALGVTSLGTVDTPSRLVEALGQAKAAKGPTFIHAKVKPRDVPAVLRGA